MNGFQRDTTSFFPPSRMHKWSNKFLEEKKKSIKENEERRRKLEENRKLYRPKTVNGFRECDDIIRQENYNIAFTPCVYPDKFGTRNKSCLLCCQIVSVNTDDRLKKADMYQDCRKCELCPALAHKKCIKTYDIDKKTDNEKKDILSKLQPIKEKSPNSWWCPDCTFELTSYIQHERFRLRMFRKRKLEFVSALRLQANFVMVKERNRYQVLRNGFLRLQALSRGVADRQGFMNEVATTHRAFKIKIGEYYELLHLGNDGRTNISCISCVVNNDQSDGELDEYDDEETQLYRFETQTVQHGTSGRWNDTFMVYYSNSLVTLTFTVYERDDSLIKSIFLGQAIVDASNYLQIAFLCGKCQRFKVHLGALQKTPLEQGSKTMFRMDKIDCPGAGKILVEIQPFSNVDSKCGVLEEILSALLKGARKKWYAVLANRQLFLFSQFGDSRPKLVISLVHGTSVVWHEKKVIKIMTIEHTWLLTCPGAQQRNSWYTKLKGTYRETLHKGAQEFKEQAQYLVDERSL